MRNFRIFSILQFIKNLKELNIRILIRQLRRIHDKRCNQKNRSHKRYGSHSGIKSFKRSVPALIPIENYWTSNLPSVCNSVQQNIKCGI
jgi:hypothetical protein